jgi:leucyl/phenylalanyl-tRNA--protein transferase
MHELGWAHSVEIWQSGSLVGGLYGMALGGFFAGESMFHSRRDASKAAVVFLVERLRQRGFRLFDVQQSTPHLRRMGAKLIRRREFLARLAQCLELPVTFG